MTAKDENEIFYAVKGHLIPSHWSQKDIDSMIDSYIKRLWGNCERLPCTSERFEQVWKEQKLLTSQEQATSMTIQNAKHTELE